MNWIFVNVPQKQELSVMGFVLRGLVSLGAFSLPWVVWFEWVVFC